MGAPWGIGAGPRGAIPPWDPPGFIPGIPPAGGPGGGPAIAGIFPDFIDSGSGCACFESVVMAFATSWKGDSLSPGSNP
jgi:hypothetical protein